VKLMSLWGCQREGKKSFENFSVADLFCFVLFVPPCRLQHSGCSDMETTSANKLGYSTVNGRLYIWGVPWSKNIGTNLKQFDEQ
jgi:hypothetical protein